MAVVLLAAGSGSRLKERFPHLPKPLIPILGKPLLAHVLERLFCIEPERIVVVTGHEHGQIERFLTDQQLPCFVETVYNSEYRRENGSSLLCVRPLVREKFVLAMADHLVDPAIYRIAARAEGLGLCVDRTPALQCQMNDATRVLVEEGSVKKIGKDLTEWNALDTGVFSLTPEIFDVLDEIKSPEHFTITRAMRVLIAQQHSLQALDVSGQFWADIDTPEDLREAERLCAAFPSPGLRLPLPDRKRGGNGWGSGEVVG